MTCEKEMAYLRSVPGAHRHRFPNDQDDVAPAGFEFDSSFIHIGGHDVTRTRKHKNVAAGSD